MNVSEMWHGKVKITASSGGGWSRLLALIPVVAVIMLVATYAEGIALGLTIVASLVVAAQLAVIARGVVDSRVPRRAKEFAKRVDFALATRAQQAVYATSERVAELEPASLVIDHAALNAQPWEHEPVDLDALTRGQ